MERLVRLAHISILGRAPAADYQEHWTVMLNVGQKTFGQFLDSLLESDEFPARAAELISRRPVAGPIGFAADRSQYGEIGLLLREMVNAAAKHRIVVNVGANSIEGSNSYNLMKDLGWRGLLIEPNTHLMADIEAAFAGLDYKLLNTAVSDHQGKAVLHLGVASGISSLHRGSVEQWGEHRGEMEVPVSRLPPILEANDIPKDFDLLSIDTEGEDIRIFNDVCSSDYFPRWVIFEAYEASKIESLRELDRELSPLVIESYRIVAKTYANLVLARRDVG